MAGAPASIKVEGLQQTIKSLQALGADKTEIQDANYQAAVKLITTARPLVPVQTGRLLSSLKPGRTTMYAVARAGSTRVPYANPIHWGWFLDKKTGIKRNIKPQPFFGKALGYSKDQIIADYDRNMQQLIDKYHLGKSN
jgi:hypothetical protein